MGFGGALTSGVFSYYIQAHDTNADAAGSYPPYVPGAGLFAVSAMYAAALVMLLATKRRFGFLATDTAPAAVAAGQLSRTEGTSSALGGGGGGGVAKHSDHFVELCDDALGDARA